MDIEKLSQLRKILIANNKSVSVLEYTKNNYDDSGNLINEELPTITTDFCEIGVCGSKIYLVFIIESKTFNLKVFNAIRGKSSVKIYSLIDFNKTLYPAHDFNYANFTTSIQQDRYLQIQFDFADMEALDLFVEYINLMEIFAKSEMVIVNQLKIDLAKKTKEEYAVPYVLIFDVDGVLTHPSEKSVTEPELFTQFVTRLRAGECIILNTGRGADFIIRKILEPLEKLINDKKLLKNLLAVGEKGAITIQYDELGKRTEYVDQSISVPEVLQIEARQLVAEKFSGSVFYDMTKKTMISIEMRDGLAVDEFREKQEVLNKELLEMLARHQLGAVYKIDPSRIATDVENKHVGKGLGTQKALQWLTEKGIKPVHFFAFGDSPSDVEMAAELHRRGLSVEFVFVGEKVLLAGKKIEFPITYTTKQCEAGTLEYLKNLS